MKRRAIELDKIIFALKRVAEMQFILLNLGLDALVNDLLTRLARVDYLISMKLICVNRVALQT